MRRHSESARKYLLLASVLMLMLVLCGCRTRLTNNTEVSATLSDEDGSITGTYEMRREELGSPVAQKPIFTGWGSDDDDSYYDDDGPLDPYDQYDEDDWVEPDEPSTDSSGSSSGSSGSTSSSRSSTSKTKTSDKITITLDLKDGEDTKNTMKVKMNTPYEDFLPTDAVRDGYEFIEWTTDKANKEPVDLKAKATKDQTLYAHWKKVEEKTEDKPADKKVYTIDFDGNGGGDNVVLSAGSIQVEENGTYSNLPSAQRNGYDFTGWYTDKTGGKKINEGDSFTENKDQKLYAHWKGPIDKWEETFTEDVQKVTAENEVTCYVDDGSNAEKDLVDQCRGINKLDTDNPFYIICFIKNYDDAKAQQKAEDLYNKYKDSNTNLKKIIIVSEDAISGNDNLRTLYKLMLLDAMYETVGIDDLNKAANDLGVTGIYPYVYNVNAQAGGGGEGN